MTHKQLEAMLTILAKSDGPLTPLEWMHTCYTQHGIEYHTFTDTVNALRSAGIIRAMGVVPHVNAYTLDHNAWNKIHS